MPIDSAPDAISRLVQDFTKVLADQTARIEAIGDDASIADIRHLSAAIKDLMAAAKANDERTRAAAPIEDEAPVSSPELINAFRRAILGDEDLGDYDPADD